MLQFSLSLVKTFLLFCVCRVWPSLRQEGVGADRRGWQDTTWDQPESHGKEREYQRILSKYVHIIHVKMERMSSFLRCCCQRVSTEDWWSASFVVASCSFGPFRNSRRSSANVKFMLRPIQGREPRIFSRGGGNSSHFQLQRGKCCF